MRTRRPEGQHDTGPAFERAVDQGRRSPDQARMLDRAAGHRDDLAGEVLVLHIAVASATYSA
jgi:hypothetical protein